MPPLWITTIATLASLSLIVSGEVATSISILPANRRKIGEDATIVCKVQAKWNADAVIWWRKMGHLQHKIGSNSLIETSFENGNRYQTSVWGEDTGSSYKLSITKLRPEDSASIGCSVPGVTDEPAYANLAVCADVENQACLCIARVGFNSPDCYEKDLSIMAWEKRYNMATTGLAVCLAIAILYGLVMSALAGLDCMGRLAAKRRQQAEEDKRRRGHDPDMYEASEELVLDASESSSQAELARSNGWKAPSERGHGYNTIKAEAVAHTNSAYNPDEDIDYQNLSDSPDMARKYNPNMPVPHGGLAPKGGPGGALPYPRPLDTYDASRYGPEVHPVGGARTAGDDGLYGARDAQSPAAWSTHSANPDPQGFRYPASAGPHQRTNGDVSPRHAQPSPRNAYSEQPPPRDAGYQRDQKDQSLRPRQLYYNQGGQARNQDYDHYSANPGGAFNDKAGLSV